MAHTAHAHQNLSVVCEFFQVTQLSNTEVLYTLEVAGEITRFLCVPDLGMDPKPLEAPHGRARGRGRRRSGVAVGGSISTSTSAQQQVEIDPEQFESAGRMSSKCAEPERTAVMSSEGNSTNIVPEGETVGPHYRTAAHDITSGLKSIGFCYFGMAKGLSKARQGNSECGAILNIIDTSSARTPAGQNQGKTNLPAGAPIYMLARQLLTLQLLACLSAK